MRNTELSKKELNAERLRKFIFLKIKNNKLKQDIEKYMKRHPDSVYKDYLWTLCRHVSSCGSFVLMKDMGDNDYEYVAAHTCKDKLCAICNADRMRAVRARYRAWFAHNPCLWSDGEKLYTYATRPRSADTSVWYDLMHLTLTVPHTKDGGYKGEKIYYKQIIQDFNRMRKMEAWLYWVYGGEYGVEATENGQRWSRYKRMEPVAVEPGDTECGLHIHIHALLLVRREHRSRNKLHKEILKMWNRITMSRDYERNEFTPEVIDSIKKGNQMLTDNDIAELSPYGATFIGLKNIFYLDKETGQYIYTMEDPEARNRAVLETISYHYKPKMFELENGHFDVAKIASIYAKTKGLVLYRKFGCLHKDPTLNVKDTTLIDELYAAKEAEEEATGTTTDTVGRSYFITSPLNMYVKNRTIHVKDARRVKDLPNQSTRGALASMQALILRESITGKTVIS